VKKKAAWLLLIAAAALLVLISATAFFINLYRDAIALGVARTALGGSGVEVTDVSVQSISSSEVLFDTILVELAGGGTLFIEGITLPVRFRGLRDARLHIDSVRFAPSTAATGPVRLAASLQAFLDAPDAMPGATVAVDRALLPGIPVIRDLAWHADPLNPALQATVADFDLFLTTTELPEGGHKGSIRALLADDTEAVMAALLVVPDGPGFKVHGTFSTMLEPLLPALHALGALPAEVVALPTTVAGAFDLGLDADETLPVGIRIEFETAPGAAAVYDSQGSRVRMSILEPVAGDATLEYPSLEWSARVPHASLSITGPDLALPPVRLRNSECRFGIHCRTALEMAFENQVFGSLTIDRITVNAPDVTFLGGADRWEASAPATHILVKGVAIGGRRVLAPVVQAELAASQDRLSAAAKFWTSEGGLSGAAVLSHDPVERRGELSLDSATIEFDKLPLSKLFSDWPHEWDVEAGRATADAGFRWTSTDSGLAVEGSAMVNADGLAGRYGDIAFVDFGTRLDVELGPDAQLAVKPARFDVALVDVGFPIENITGTAAPDIGAAAIAITGLSMNVLGGTVTAEPFRFDLDADSNELVLLASAIQLPLMAGLADLEAVTISGSVSGKIPVTLRGNNVTINDGQLENDPPGGVIRYRGGAAEGIVGDGSQLGVVTRTLRNFEFDSLSSAVRYSEDGDLVLRMRLKGINPDVDPTQPVILNLNVENNVPQMLRSLQATRSIEDVLERSLSK